MTGKRRTPLPRSPTRKRKPRSKPAPPRPKGETERLAVRRCAAMKYRLAGASYRTIAEKLTEERAQAYADEHGVSVERAMKKITHVSVRTVWDDVTAELEELRRETEMQRADLMALENARLDQVFSKALSRFANGSVPAGRLADWLSRRWDGVAFSLPDRCRYASRSEPVSRYAANASYAGSLSVVSLSQGRWVSVIRRALLLVNHGLQILSDGPAFSGRAPAGRAQWPVIGAGAERSQEPPLGVRRQAHGAGARVPRASSSPAEPLTYQPETIF